MTVFVILACIATASHLLIAAYLVAAKHIVPFFCAELVSGTISETDSASESPPKDMPPIQDQLDALNARLDHLTELLVAVLESKKHDEAETTEKKGSRQPLPTFGAGKTSPGAKNPIRRRAAPAPGRRDRAKKKAPSDSATA